MKLKQHARLFIRGKHWKSTDDQLNDYLENHPEYEIDKINFQKISKRKEYLFVVFKTKYE